jgi:hypothetical protein
MKTIHFEIGHNRKLNPYEIENMEDTTESVFRSDCLSDCLKEFAEKGYTEPEYFIDVWEQDGIENPPYPLGDIKIDAWTLADYQPQERKK